jgi:hypothetical protein
MDIGIFFGAAYFLFLFDLALPGLGAALFTAAVLVVVIASRFKEREEYIKEISDKIYEELEKGVGSQQRTITKALEEKLKTIRDYYTGVINGSFSKIQEKLNKRINDANTRLAKSQSERERIGNAAANFRNQELEPLQQEIEQFQVTVEGTWPT